MKILAFPRDTNPYQELLYRPLRERGVAVEYLEGPTGSHTLNVLLLPLLLTVWRLRGFTVLHVHWTFPFRLPFGGRPVRAIMELWTAGFWLLAKLYGMQLVWTVHNAQPHEPVFWNDRRAHRFLARCANRVIVHTSAAKQQLQELGIVSRHLAIIPHGSYIGVHPDVVSDAAARLRLKLPTDKTVFLLFGLLRPSKGVEQLLEVFGGLSSPDAVLQIAGSVTDTGLRRQLEAAAARDTRIRLTLRYIPDDELQYFFRAADFAVLPYEQSTTSGVSLLACSFGTPLLTPDQPAFADLPEAARISYAAGDLAGGLQQALQTAPTQRHAYGRPARAYAEQLSWDEIATRTLAFLKGDHEDR